MRFHIPKRSETTLYLFLRRCGFRLLAHKEGGEGNFVRAIGAASYPRFHIYAQEVGDKWRLNLHLDQRRPVYRGTKAHSGEYEGRVVEGEQKRIQQAAPSER